MNILDLDKFQPDAKTVRIDGDEYRLLLPNDLTLREQKYCQYVFHRVSKASAADDEKFDERRAGELDELINNTIAIILPDVPKETLAKITQRQKMAIIEAWSAEAKKETSSGEENSEPDPIAPPQNSSDSTAETQSDG